MTEAQRIADRIETENYEAAAELRRLDAEFTACYSSLVSQEEKNAALEAECEQLKADLTEQCKIIGGSAETELLLRAECEALRKDAERYRWLVANSSLIDKEGVTQMHCELHTWEPHSLTGLPTEWTQRVRGPAICRFIDAAMGKEQSND